MRFWSTGAGRDLTPVELNVRFRCVVAESCRTAFGHKRALAVCRTADVRLRAQNRHPTHPSGLSEADFYQ
jgi:hypothetical protein